MSPSSSSSSSASLSLVSAIFTHGSMLLSMSLVAPLPIFPSPYLNRPRPGLILGSVLLLGTALPFIVVSAFMRLEAAAEREGFPPNVDTFLMLTGEKINMTNKNKFLLLIATLTLKTGLWTTFYYLGNGLGPVLGGALVQWLGFEQTAAVFALVYVAMAAVNVVEAVCLKRRGRCQKE